MAVLEGKKILVTGAARGNGAGIARGLAEAGADVVVADIERERGEALARELGTAEFRHCDVTDEAQIVDVFGELARLDGLVNNAGILTRSNLVDMSKEMFAGLLRVNLRGYFLCAREAAKKMSSRGGAIVSICSTNGRAGTAGMAHYGAAKAGILAMTRAMAVELAPQNIRVNTVSPGVIPTALNADRLSSPEAIAHTVANIPLGRLGEPSDLVGAVTLLLSDQAAWTTGIDILIDGGQLAV